MKSDIVSAAVSKFQDAQAQVIADQLGNMYDAAQADMPAQTGGISQADEDAAVAAQASTDAADKAAGIAAVQAQLDATTQALADMTAKDKTDSAANEALKASIAGIQAALDELEAIVVPSDPVTPADPLVGDAQAAPALREPQAVKQTPAG